ncbi:MAG: UDP-N-acetylmuramate dehydrogenase [Polyangiaceae bacterium]
MQLPAFLSERVPLAPLTTLGVGGAARYFARASTLEEIERALDWARETRVPLFVLGGGSNLLVGDAGFDGLVLQIATRGVRDEGGGRVRVSAGEPWDAFVAWTVERGLAGVECMSGIPGTTGATPVQNVGAYGQEVSETIREVELIDRATGERSIRSASACGFGYRDSVFKRADRDRFVVTEVRFALEPGGAPSLRYAELAKHCAARFDRPSLADVRAAVIELRASKSMVLREDDENRRSAGSFFVNPIVPRSIADDVAARWARISTDGSAVPRWPAGDDVKLSAGWLIERSGFAKGTARGEAGISTRHALAIVNRGGATAAAITALRDEVIAAVRRTFGVELTQEPESIGR